MHLVEDALGQLGRYVTHMSHGDALRSAFTAYFNFKDANPTSQLPYLYFVDYGLDPNSGRGYVFNMVRLSWTDGPFTVAHGRGSSQDRNGIPTRFSNVDGSHASSLGLYLTLDTYERRGDHHGLALRLSGRSGDFNSNAYTRLIVVHGAPYVGEHHAGRSEGCPAMEMRRAAWLIPLLANGSVVFLFSPNHVAWMAGDPWVHAKRLPNRI